MNDSSSTTVSETITDSVPVSVTIDNSTSSTIFPTSTSSSTTTSPSSSTSSSTSSSSTTTIPSSPAETLEISFLDSLQGLLFFWYRSNRPQRPLPSGHVEEIWKEVWFAKQQDQIFIDEELKRFEPLLVEVSDTLATGWMPEKPLEKIAVLILVDQVPRNIYRGHSRSYDYDKYGYRIATSIVNDTTLFNTLPLHMQYTVMIAIVHSERLEDQNKVCTYGSTLPFTLLGQRMRDIANNHRERIVLFGRFPERNRILGRESTDSEMTYLQSIYPKY